ncbi:MAG: hypothetical protein HXY40_15940 [Chloroflexi bacterium]|nr:hypothetical protein [Chloroflexota bacterium]
MKVLVAYASAHGSTAEVGHFLKRVLSAYDTQVSALNVSAVEAVWEYDAFVLGSAIQDGMWLHAMFQFIERFRTDLVRKPCYMWINCVRVIEPDGYEHAMKHYIHQPTIETLNVREVAVFAGKLSLETIDWNERWLLSLRYDGSERPGTFNKDFRNWEVIAAWGNKIARELGLAPTFEGENIVYK